MTSIADGAEFPQLQKTIEEVTDLFSDMYHLNSIMADQLFLPIGQDDREQRVELVVKKLGEDIERLASKMCDLSEFMFRDSIERMAKAA
ncbi:hypothetical protein [Sphingopyxis sp. GW247-27LB]|uniref:hypothetical protein n=1 Tax=Sphingopyxis sp. GW247-27LB TaxID=2012632 RepID=UPI000BA5D2C6|nr:hypothetical protein [Sphingopyxis sp. GW247-27LB]PAL22658.1 hypothetical protein CD928_11395 [Sphingopyxis sp. GW247-27LB]